MKFQMEELNGMGAYTFCRHLLPMLDGADAELQVYRRDTLAYTIKSIQKAALLTLSETSRDGFVISKYRGFK